MDDSTPVLTLQETADGSKTLYRADLQETYHSTHGARQESEHVFIAAGYHHAASKFVNTPLCIFEVGFGTGLNALLSLQQAEKLRRPVIYTTVEPYPVPQNLLADLQYADPSDATAQQAFLAMHRLPWGEAEPRTITPHFQLRKVRSTLQSFAAEQPFAHLVYYDAFAPSKQPELWEEGPLQQCYELLLPEGILVTYSASGQFRRNLKAVGFTVENLPGPPGKREMTRAIRPA